MINIIKRNLDEIKASSGLMVYGGFLSIGHIFTFFYWTQSEFVLKGISSADTNPLCWPYFSSCASYRLDYQWLRGLIFTYLLLAIVTAGLFFWQKSVKWAYGLFALTFLIKIFLYIQSYRMMGNYHYMYFIIGILFLLMPRKKDVIRLMIVGFYLAAGTLKLNNEWLSGSALYGMPILQGKWLVAACAYVVFLELVVSFFLLSSKRIYFYLALFQFFCFHIFSWHIVGFFYPCIMICLLSIFVLSFEEKSFSRLKLAASTWLVLGLFAVAQLVPYLYRGDTALTGEGRFWALNMFDVKSECEFRAFARFDKRIEDFSWKAEGLGPRIKCDPIVYASYMQNVCRVLKVQADFHDIDVDLVSKRTSERDFKKIVHQKDVCQKNLQFRLLGENSWVEFETIPSQADEPKDKFPNAFLFQNKKADPPQASETTSQYREGLSKNGVSLWQLKGFQLKIAWQSDPLNVGVHSAAKSSPAVDESGIYLGSDSGWFFAYNFDGSLKWRFYIGYAWRGIHGTAALDKDTVYFGTYSGTIFALDKVTGEIRWFHDLGLALGASVALFEDSIYANVELNPPDGYVARLSRREGTLIWHSHLLGEQGHSSPVVSPSSRLVYVGDNAGHFTAFDMKTGAAAWVAVAQAPVKSTAAVIDSQVIFTSWDHFIYSYDLNSGQLRWAQDMGNRSHSSPTLVPGARMVIYGVDKTGYQASDIETGEIVWRISTNQNNMASALVTYVKSRRDWIAWIPCESKMFCAVSAKTGQVLNRYELPATYTSVPVAYQDSIFLALDSPGGLIRFDAH